MSARCVCCEGRDRSCLDPNPPQSFSVTLTEADRAHMRRIQRVALRAADVPVEPAHRLFAVLDACSLTGPSHRRLSGVPTRTCAICESYSPTHAAARAVTE